MRTPARHWLDCLKAHPRWSGGGLAIVVLVLLGSLIVPGIFTIDEANYMMTVHAVREGTLLVPDLDGLPVSTELLYMDPSAPFFDSAPARLAAPAPPWYAGFAVLFAGAGLRGLIALNLLACLGALILVFHRLLRLTGAAWLAGLGAAVCAGGTYLAEYAFGVWPHGLATLLCTAGYMLCLPLRPAASPAWRECLPKAMLGGLLLGLSAGVRYQNIVFAGLVMMVALLTRPARLKRAVGMLVGLAIPLGGAALMNGLRHGSWNPISKPGHGYTALHAAHALGRGEFVSALHDMAVSFMARVVDYAFIYPRPIGFLPSHPPVHGIILCGGVVKKAWLQSCPWLLAVAVLVLLGLRPLKALRQTLTPRRRELVGIGAVIAGILALFTVAGAGRFDGLCYNQRYFIELLPLAAMAFALTCGGMVRRHLLAFVVACLLVVLALAAGLQLLPASAVVRQVLISKLPILLAGATALTVLLARSRRGARFAAVCLLGATVGWAAGIHFLEELPSSRRVRQYQGASARAIAAAMPATGEPVMLVAHWAFSMLSAPLELSHPGLVIVDPRTDQGADCPALVEAALSSGRRVVVVLNDMPPEVYQRISQGRPTRWLLKNDPAVGGIGMVEIGRAAIPADAAGASGDMPD